MEADDGLAPGGDLALQFLNRDVKRARIDINNLRHGADVQQRDIRRGAGEQGPQHFIAFLDAGKQIGEVECIGAGTGEYARAGLVVLRPKAGLEQVDFRALPDPAAVEGVAYVFLRPLGHMRVKEYDAIFGGHRWKIVLLGSGHDIL
jgi:hypothetical protein